MSRSIPTQNSPNPSCRFFEWDGSKGGIRYYDKDKKENVELGLKFTFIFLDELATVKGWHEPSESGIFSNEVRDTREQQLLVKAFKGGQIAEGFYKDIKDKVVAAGGHFTANIYIGFKNGNSLSIGSLQFKGAALNAWVDFRKANQKAIHEKAVTITGTKDGKKGKVVFKTPVMAIKDITEETNTEAMALDKQLQEYLDGYFKRKTTERVAPAGAVTDTAEEPPEDHQNATAEAEVQNHPDDENEPF